MGAGGRRRERQATYSENDRRRIAKALAHSPSAAENISEKAGKAAYLQNQCSRLIKHQTPGDLAATSSPQRWAPPWEEIRSNRLNLDLSRRTWRPNLIGGKSARATWLRSGAACHGALRFEMSATYARINASIQELRMQGRSSGRGIRGIPMTRVNSAL